MSNKAFTLGSVIAADEARKKASSPRRTAPLEEEPLKPFNVRLPASQVTALGRARLDDGITAVARIRTLVALWQEDDDLRQRVATRASS